MNLPDEATASEQASPNLVEHMKIPTQQEAEEIRTTFDTLINLLWELRDKECPQEQADSTIQERIKVMNSELRDVQKKLFALYDRGYLGGLMPTRSEVEVRRGKQIQVHFIPKAALGSFHGMARRQQAQVWIRDDLSAARTQVVRDHEVYHVIDPYVWGGAYGREIRAIWHSFISHPILFAIAHAQAPFRADFKKRILLYVDRILKGY